MQAESESPDKRKLYYILVHDFFEALFDNRLGYYASSLSWSTLFAIIPILVILLAVFTSMPLFNALYEQVHSWLFENFLPTDSKEIMGYIDEFVANSGKLGMMGVAYVLIAAIMFFKDYDYVVNDIFETKKRTVWEALKTYTGLIIIVPMMLGSSFYLSSMIRHYLDTNDITSAVHFYFFFPFLVIWGMFYISYQLSAHKKISKVAALLSSFVASMVWYLAKSGFVFYVTSNQTYTSVYGSISILLFFFLWIYISWAIFLYGLRLCYILDKEKEIGEIE
ncbi:MAG TPA: YihY family inner membrane protein [Epsilonproteobacteria bacterium]|nr:YihY family inner membrane protein [Campylobacterota bacterium]